jgi:hypothetical protein
MLVIAIVTLLLGIAVLPFSLFVFLKSKDFIVSPDGATVAVFSYDIAVELLRFYAFWFTPTLAIGLMWAGFSSWKIYRRCKLEGNTHVDA